MTSTEYTSNFFFTFGLGDDVDAFLRDTAEEFAKDFSAPRFRTAYLKAINEAVEPFGLTVAASGIAYRDTADELPDRDAIKQAVYDALSDDWLEAALEYAAIDR